MNKKAQAGSVYWKVATYILAIALLIWIIFYYTGLKDKIGELLGQFFSFFR
jgi:hypothetical protein